MGVTDEPAPDDLIGVYSVSIGESGAARYAEMVSHGAAELQRLLARYIAIDKILPKWLTPGALDVRDSSQFAPIRFPGADWP